MREALSTLTFRSLLHPIAPYCGLLRLIAGFLQAVCGDAGGAVDAGLLRLIAAYCGGFCRRSAVMREALSTLTFRSL